MKIRQVIQFLEKIAPPVYQESYDNSGLLTGNSDAPVSGVVCSLDAIEPVIDEAIEKGANLVVAHHPIIFRGLKRITGKNYIERVIIKAIKNDIAIYAIHTNLDNMLHQGVNTRFAERLGLVNTKVLQAKKNLFKLTVRLSKEYKDIFQQELSATGASMFDSRAVSSNASLISQDWQFASGIQSALIPIIRKYSSDYEILTLENKNAETGSGRIGELPAPMQTETFLSFLKKKMQTDCIRHTIPVVDTIKKVAICGGAGGFLLPQAIRSGADVFVTADYKYHEFFDANGQIMIADIGHYESEQFTINLLQELISQNFSNFATYCTKVNTNPVHYYT